MKKIYFSNKNKQIFEIAKIIKSILPQEKIFIKKISINKKEKIIIKLPKEIDKLKIQELNFLLKKEYPDLELSYNYF